ncbi:MAG: type 4a pilus biogenesis protein PilO [Deltaproteobacteria bacterium]|nr:type 4a pilus biogenesis protein PilO [Deltaproteobacteria bacterium]
MAWSREQLQGALRQGALVFIPLGLAVLLLVFLVARRGEVARLDRELRQIQGQIRLSQQELTRVAPATPTEQESWEQSKGVVDDLLPRDPALPRLFEQLARVGSEVGVVGLAITASAPAATPFTVGAETLQTRAIPIRVSFRGSYMAAARFMGGLRQARRFLTVDRLTIQREGPAMLAVELQLRVYSTGT